MSDGPRLRSLRGDRAFQRLRKGRSGGAKHLSIRLRPTRHGQVRLGVVVSRKVGKAVVRNRVRRRLREAMLALLREASRRGDEPAPAAPRPLDLPASFDVLVITRPSAAEADYAELARSLRQALERALAAGGRPATLPAGSGAAGAS